VFLFKYIDPAERPEGAGFGFGDYSREEIIDSAKKKEPDASTTVAGAC